jgi:hypothetical protein
MFVHTLGSHTPELTQANLARNNFDDEGVQSGEKALSETFEVRAIRQAGLAQGWCLRLRHACDCGMMSGPGRQATGDRVVTGHTSCGFDNVCRFRRRNPARMPGVS